MFFRCFIIDYDNKPKYCKSEVIIAISCAPLIFILNVLPVLIAAKIFIIPEIKAFIVISLVDMQTATKIITEQYLFLKYVSTTVKYVNYFTYQFTSFH